MSTCKDFTMEGTVIDEDDDMSVVVRNLGMVANIDKNIQETKAMIKPLTLRLKTLTLERKELEKVICPVMKTYNIRDTELPGNTGIIKLKISHTMVPMTQRSVKDKLRTFFTDGPGHSISFNSLSPDAKGETLYNYIYGRNNREYVEKESLCNKKA